MFRGENQHAVNANMIIGGKVRRCKRLSSSSEILESLDVIEEQGKVIDAAVGALRELARVVVLRESSGQVAMIDLARELDARLEATKRNS